VAVASAALYATLHLAPDRQQCQHPTTQFLQTGCPSCRPTNSVKALKAYTTTTKNQQAAAQAATSRIGAATWQITLAHPGYSLCTPKLPFMWGSRPPTNTRFLGPTRVDTINGISIGSTVIAQLMTDRHRDHGT